MRQDLRYVFGLFLVNYAILLFIIYVYPLYGYQPIYIFHIPWSDDDAMKVFNAYISGPLLLSGITFLLYAMYSKFYNGVKALRAEKAGSILLGLLFVLDCLANLDGAMSYTALRGPFFVQTILLPALFFICARFFKQSSWLVMLYVFYVFGILAFETLSGAPIRNILDIWILRSTPGIQFIDIQHLVGPENLFWFCPVNTSFGVASLAIIGYILFYKINMESNQDELTTPPPTS